MKGPHYGVLVLDPYLNILDSEPVAGHISLGFSSHLAPEEMRPDSETTCEIQVIVRLP